MPTTLPSGIETYLADSGFSEGELLVLRLLLQTRSKTASGIAKKLGISAAESQKFAENLVSKRILSRGTINGQNRYSIQSLEKVVSWVKSDMGERDSHKKTHDSQDEMQADTGMQKKFASKFLLPIVLICIFSLMFTVIVGLFKLKIGFFEPRNLTLFQKCIWTIESLAS